MLNDFPQINLVSHCYIVVISYPMSLYKSRTVRHFHGTEFEIWAGFGLVDTKKLINIKSDFRSKHGAICLDQNTLKTLTLEYGMY